MHAIEKYSWIGLDGLIIRKRVLYSEPFSASKVIYEIEKENHRFFRQLIARTITGQSPEMQSKKVSYQLLSLELKPTVYSTR